MVTISLKGRRHTGVDRVAGPYVMLPDKRLVLAGAEKGLQANLWAQVALYLRFFSAVPARMDDTELGFGLLELFSHHHGRCGRRGGGRGDLGHHGSRSSVVGLEWRRKGRRVGRNDHTMVMLLLLLLLSFRGRSHAHGCNDGRRVRIVVVVTVA